MFFSVHKTHYIYNDKIKRQRYISNIKSKYVKMNNIAIIEISSGLTKHFCKSVSILNVT